MAIAESLAPLDGKTVLIVGAAGAVGSFTTQFTARAGAHVAAVAPAADRADEGLRSRRDHRRRGASACRGRSPRRRTRTASTY